MVRNLEESFAAHIPDVIWHTEMDRLCSKLKSYSINDTRVGMEIEFAVVPAGSLAAFEQKKAGFIADLEKQLPGDDGTIAKKLKQLREFNPAELLMYELIEKNPRTKDMLEYSFGKGETGSGYYDSPGILELRLKHCAPSAVCRNRHIVLDEIEKIIDSYHLAVTMPPNYHINFSFWENGENTFDIKNASHTTTGARICEGINKAMFDGLLFAENPQKRMLMKNIAISGQRISFLRQANGRLEVRLLISDIPYQHPESIVTTVLAGAAYGLEAHKSGNKQALLAAVPNRRHIFSKNGPELTRVLHLLNTATSYGAERTLHLDGDYLTNAFSGICQELGMISSPHEYAAVDAAAEQWAFTGEMPASLKSYYTPIVTAAASINLDVKPIRFPGLFARANGYITYEGQYPSFETPYGYDAQKINSPAKRVALLAESPVFKSMLSPQLFHALRDMAAQVHGMPDRNDIAYVREHTPAAGLFSSRERKADGQGGERKL